MGAGRRDIVKHLRGRQLRASSYELRALNYETQRARIELPATARWRMGCRGLSTALRTSLREVLAPLKMTVFFLLLRHTRLEGTISGRRLAPPARCLLIRLLPCLLLAGVRGRGLAAMAMALPSFPPVLHLVPLFLLRGVEQGSDLIAGGFVDVYHFSLAIVAREGRIVAQGFHLRMFRL